MKSSYSSPNDITKTHIRHYDVFGRILKTYIICHYDITYCLYQKWEMASWKEKLLLTIAKSKKIIKQLLNSLLIRIVREDRIRGIASVCVCVIDHSIIVQ
jgi:hypothetical protein